MAAAAGSASPASIFALSNRARHAAIRAAVSACAFAGVIELSAMVVDPPLPVPTSSFVSAMAIQTPLATFWRRTARPAPSARVLEPSIVSDPLGATVTVAEPRFAATTSHAFATSPVPLAFGRLSRVAVAPVAT